MKGIGFIGAGNMGGAMAKSIAKKKEEDVFIYDNFQQAYEKFEGDAHVIPTHSIEELMSKAKYIVLSVKPQYYKGVCESVKAYLKAEHVIVSITPSYTLENLKELLGKQTSLIRTMPNTPALVGEGITAFCYQEDQVSQDNLEGFKSYFECFGRLVRVNEELMPAIVAASGSSPAYVYMFIEAMADAAVSFGMPRQMAYEFCAASVKGAAQMVLETKQHPGELKDAVSSPAGTTIDAVMALEEYGMRNSVIKAMQACYNKSNEMTKNA